jgi:hypothetical protein
MKPVQRKSSVLIVSSIVLAFLWTSHLILSVWGIEIHRCEGDSMQPTIGSGAIYVVRKNPQTIHLRDVVTARIQAEGEICRVVKRVSNLDDQQVLLTGDNAEESWTGWVPVSAVEGKLVAVLWQGRVKPPLSAVSHNVQLASAPREPSALALIGMGVLCLAVYGWQRWRRTCEAARRPSHKAATGAAVGRQQLPANGTSRLIQAVRGENLMSMRR